MKKYFLILVLFVSYSTLKAQETINWLSFEKAIQMNSKNPKYILIDVYTDWCGWCKKLDNTTYKNDSITKYINEHFYAVKLDGEGKEDITYNGQTFKYKEEGRSKYNEFAAMIMNGKLSYPTTIIMGKNEKVLDNIPGYLDEKNMEKILVFFAKEKYKTTTWADFTKSFKSNL
jgi:thioredoxin-related protein